MKKIAQLTLIIGISIMSLSGVILWLGGEFFASSFTSDQQAIEQIVIALKIDAVAQPLLAMSLILPGIFQGMGDSKTPLYATLVGIWGVRVVGILLLTKVWQLGIAGVWLTMTINLCCRSLFLLWRLKARLTSSPTKTLS